MKVVVSQNTAIGKVNFSKVAHLGEALSLDSLTDVVITDPQGSDGLIYDSNLNKFVNKPVQTTVIDGGTF